MKPAVFLDRDGVINIDKGYVNKISEFEWIKGSQDAIKYIKERGYYISVSYTHLTLPTKRIV